MLHKRRDLHIIWKPEFDSFDDKALIPELLNGMYAELPEKKPKKATR